MTINLAFNNKQWANSLRNVSQLQHTLSTLQTVEAEAKLKELEAEIGKAFGAKDLDALMNHYHPDAVMIHKGVKSYYGLEGLNITLTPWVDFTEIRGGLKTFLDHSTGAPEEMAVKPLYAGISIDGLYLIRRGTFHATGQDWPMEQIYKKEGDKYLVYHDEFEYSA